MKMRKEQWAQSELAGDTEVFGENLLKCHFVNNKSHMTDLGSSLGRRCGKPGTDRLSYSMAYLISLQINSALNRIAI
jgi:hypothetical protein